MKDARRLVAEAVTAGSSPGFEPLWADYKGHLSRAQHRKCGWCEVKNTTEPGAVDHFRPKSEVSALFDDPATWGRELPDRTNVHGRKTRRLAERGYWWLAYEWTNLVFICNRCNSPWKGTLFPVLPATDATERCLPPDQNVEEEILLLDPYGTEDPSEHLSFDVLGQVGVRSGSRKGMETIRTLGLDRESLRDSREEKASMTLGLIARLRMTDGRAFDETLRDLRNLGRVERAHAGMVRILVKHQTEIDWAELENLVDSLPD